MERYAQIRDVIKELYEDNKNHDLTEIKEKCKEREIDIEADSNAVSNVVYSMKRKGFLRATEEKGVYEKIRHDISQGDAKEMDSGQACINWNRFFVLKPQTTRFQEMLLTITEKGEIRLNSRLQKEINSREIELIFSRDYKEVLLNTRGQNPHKFTKAGVAKNRDISNLLKKEKIPLPSVYIVCWNENYKMLHGKLAMDKGK